MASLQEWMGLCGGVQHGRDLEAAGLTRAEVRHALQRGWLVRVHPSTYVTPVGGHDRAVLRAAGLAAASRGGDGGAVLPHERRRGAGVARALAQPRGARDGEPPGPPAQWRRSVVHRLRAPLTGAGVRSVEGHAATAPERTLVDLACSARPDDVAALAAWLLQRRVTTPDRLAAAATRAGGSLGSRRVCALLAQWSPGGWGQRRPRAREQVGQGAQPRRVWSLAAAASCTGAGAWSGRPA